MKEMEGEKTKYGEEKKQARTHVYFEVENTTLHKRRVNLTKVRLFFIMINTRENHCFVLS